MNEFFRQLLNFGMADILNEEKVTKASDSCVVAGDPASGSVNDVSLINMGVTLDKNKRQFVVCGNSMSPRNIDDGDNLIVSLINPLLDQINEGDFLVVNVDPTYYEKEKPLFDYKLRCAIMVIEDGWSEEQIIEKLKEKDSQPEIWLGMYQRNLREKFRKARRHYPDGKLMLSCTYKSGLLCYSFHKLDFIKYRAEELIKPDNPQHVIILAA